MKKIMPAGIILLVSAPIGGRSQEPADAVFVKNATISANDTVSKAIREDGEQESAVPSSIPLGQCAPKWKCISSTTKAFQKQDCSWGERSKCPLGCFNDTCRAASTCDSGFKCINDHRKGYQTEACTWINDVECPGGCENGECLFYNASAAEDVAPPAAEEDSSPLPIDNSKTLRMGQQETVEINGEEHVISVYILEQSKMKFSVDGFKTDWLEEGDSATIRGVTLDVKEILFQSFSGGKQEVRYTVE